MTDDRLANPSPDELPQSFRLPPSALRLCFDALASLQLAVAFIAIYAIVLACATFIESKFGGVAARADVYGTAWFTAIHILLGINVLCAMLIRFPWHRRQAGFLMTHGGILVLLVGCAATRWFGIEAELQIYEGHANHIAKIDGGQKDDEELELGFQVYLHQFRRRLDPGSGMPSHYSSRVDFLECSDSPKNSTKPQKTRKLQENVLITLNAPVDFTDPKTGRTYRLFQSSFAGPWTPGDAEFDKLAASDHSRDQVYLSRLSVNYDPGRWLKYIGSTMIVIGIGMVYYLRGGKGKKEGGGRKAEGGPAHLPASSSDTPDEPLAASHGTPTGKCFLRLLLGVVVLLFIGDNIHAEPNQLDWSAWQHLPVLAEGRVTPLDTFARETVESICGQPTPTLLSPDAGPNSKPQKFAAAELLFAWLAEPEKWENIAFLPASDEQLRRAIGLPLVDANGRRLLCVSPLDVEKSESLERLWDELMQLAETQGKNFQLTDADKKLKKLIDAYGTYRALTFTPNSSHNTLRRFNARVELAADALSKLANSLLSAKQISRDVETRKLMVQAATAWQKLLGTMRDDKASRETIEPAVAAFHQLGDQLAARLTSPDNASLTALAANLRHQTAQMHIALYDNGETLRLLPALDPGALEENRTPDDNASPWLSFQAMAYGSDKLLQAYPQPELKAVRKAFADAKTAYQNRNATDRPREFSAAMGRFADSLRAMAAKIEPLRERLPIRHRDEDLIGATAYPPPGSTDAEVFYNRLNPFFWSWVVSLAATICLLAAVGRWQKPLFWSGAAILVVGQAIAVVGMGFRGYITGLVPLTGMFETVEFVALYSGLLGLWFAMRPLWHNAPHQLNRMDLVMQRRLFAVAGAIVSFVAAVLAYYAPATVMHRNIGSVTPILRDNFWLAVHVVTIMASYASAAIALILGNIALGYYLFGRYSKKAEQANADRHPPEACGILAGFIYTAVQITVLLLATGTILGAFWADKAWGHFWGWDPKEVWALVSLLAYVLILHTRYLGWSSDFGMVVTAVFGFTAILFTWYGVNFVLGSGMHSYGSGAGGKWAVIIAVVIEWAFLLAAAIRRQVEVD